MKRRNFFQMATIATLAATTNCTISSSAFSEEKKEKREPIRALFVFGGHGYEVESMNHLLENLPGVNVTQMEFSAALPKLKPGLKKEFDLILFYDYTESDFVTSEQQQNFVDLLKNEEIGVVFWHHAMMSHFLDDYNIIGGRYHYKAENFLGKDVPGSVWREGVDVPVKIAKTDHPITKGLEPFTLHDEVYNGISVNPEVEVLLNADHPDCAKQFLWTHSFGKCRVVYLMPGHGKTCWQHPIFPKLLTRCIQWSVYGETTD